MFEYYQRWSIKYIPIVGINLLLSIGVAFAQKGMSNATSLFDAKKYEEAKTAFKQILKRDSENGDAHYFLGRIHFHYGDYNKAKDHLEQATKIDEANIDYHIWLGKVYRDKARTSGFLGAMKWAGKWKRELERAFEIDPTHLDARGDLIGYLVNAPGIGGGDKDRGKKIAKETVPIDEIRGRLLLAYTYRKMKQTESALKEYEKVLALDPENGSAYRGLGYMFLKQKNYEEAESNFRNYIKVAADDANAYDSLGEYYLERKMRDQAIEQFQKAVEVDPEFAISRFNLAQTYDKKDMPYEAFHHYKKFVELTPGHIKVKEAKKRMKKLRSKVASNER